MILRKKVKKSKKSHKRKNPYLGPPSKFSAKQPHIKETVLKNVPSILVHSSLKADTYFITLDTPVNFRLKTFKEDRPSLFKTLDKKPSNIVQIPKGEYIFKYITSKPHYFTLDSKLYLKDLSQLGLIPKIYFIDDSLLIYKFAEGLSLHVLMDNLSEIKHRQSTIQSWMEDRKSVIYQMQREGKSLEEIREIRSKLYEKLKELDNLKHRAIRTLISNRQDAMFIMSEIEHEAARWHNKGFGHGDLYPKNIIINEHQGKVSVTFINPKNTRPSDLVKIMALKRSDVERLEYIRIQLEKITK